MIYLPMQTPSPAGQTNRSNHSPVRAKVEGSCAVGNLGTCESSHSHQYLLADQLMHQPHQLAAVVVVTGIATPDSQDLELFVPLNLTVHLTMRYCIYHLVNQMHH